MNWRTVFPWPSPTSADRLLNGLQVFGAVLGSWRKVTALAVLVPGIEQQETLGSGLVGMLVQPLDAKAHEFLDQLGCSVGIPDGHLLWRKVILFPRPTIPANCDHGNIGERRLWQTARRSARSHRLVFGTVGCQHRSSSPGCSCSRSRLCSLSRPMPSDSLAPCKPPLRPPATRHPSPWPATIPVPCGPVPRHRTPAATPRARRRSRVAGHRPAGALAAETTRSIVGSRHPSPSAQCESRRGSPPADRTGVAGGWGPSGIGQGRC